MTARERLICSILLLIARMLADDPALDADLKTLRTQIGVDHDLRLTSTQPDAGPPQRIGQVTG